VQFEKLDFRGRLFPMSDESKNINDKRRLRDTGTSDKTLVAPGLWDAVELQAAEADVAVEWNVGDVILDLYEVKEVYSGGGMGLVYKVLHTGWNTELAVKSPREDYFKTEEEKKNFIRECETWIDLGLHPHVVSCYYVRNLGNIPRVFAEYVEGGNLKEWISSKKLYQGGPDKALERILDIAIQMAWGIQYAHEKGVIHQDIKPANIMLTEDGTVKITDFGLARARAIVEESSETDSEKSILMTSYGMTPAYCSPEQANKEKLTSKTDIWSWAVTVLEMFTGEVTWAAGQIADKALEDYIKTNSKEDLIPQMPKTLIELLRHCFQRDPKSRPQDIPEISSRLIEIYKKATDNDFSKEYPEAAKLMADSLNNKVVSLLDIGRREKAIEIFEKALDEHPDHPEMTYNHGLFLWRLGKITDVQMLKNIERNNFTTSHKWLKPFMLGQVHLIRLDIGSALACLEEARKLGCEYIESSLSYAHSLQNKELKLVRAFEGHTGDIKSVCFGPRGRWALSETNFDTKLWNVSTGRCIRTFGKLVCFSPDGRWALSWVNGPLNKGELTLWDVLTGHCVRTFEGYTHTIHSACFSPDCRWALTGGGGYKEDGELKLWDVFTGRCVKMFKGHDEDVYSVCFSPDSRWALSGSGDMTMKLWEVSTGHCFRTFKGHIGKVNSICFSPDSRLALSGSLDATSPELIGGGVHNRYLSSFKLWNILTGYCVRTFKKGNRNFENSVYFSPDGRWVLSMSRNMTLELRFIPECCSFRLWDVITGNCVHTFEGHTKDVNSVYFSPDSRWVLSGSADRTMKLWEVSGGRCARTFEGHNGNINSVCFSPDSRWALSGSADGTMKLWEISTGRCVRTFEGHNGNINSVCFSPDLSWALSGSLDMTMKLWKISEVVYSSKAIKLASYILCGILPTEQTIKDQKQFNKMLKEARTSLNEGNYIKALTQIRNIRLIPEYKWPSEILNLLSNISLCCRCRALLNAHEVRAYNEHTDSVNTVCFSPDSRLVLSGGGGMFTGELKLWEVTTGRCVKKFEGRYWVVRSVCFSPDGRWALSGGNYAIKLWEISTGRCIRTFEEYTDDVNSVCISPDGHWALSGGWDKTIKLWEISSGRCVRTYKGHTKDINSVCFSPDSRWALSGSADETIKLWEISTGRCARTFEGHTESVNTACFSPDGHWAISGGWDKTMKLWEISTGRCVRTFEGHTEGVNTACFSPEGRWILSGSRDRTMKLWEVLTGNCIKTFEEYTDSVLLVDFSPNGFWVLSAIGDLTIRLWELDWELEVPELSDWDEGARPYLEAFLTNHTPYAKNLAEQQEFSEEDVKLALTHKGKPTWTDEDFKRLLYKLGCAGYGWLRPEGVRQELEKMASNLTTQKKHSWFSKLFKKESK